MYPISFRILVLVLAGLQFFAPLIHAHSGYETGVVKLHLPGFEQYVHGSEKVYFKQPVIQANNERTSTFCVGSGIPGKRLVDSPGLISAFFIFYQHHAQAPPVLLPDYRFEPSFVPLQRHPRAPPVSI